MHLNQSIRRALTLTLLALTFSLGAVAVAQDKTDRAQMELVLMGYDRIASLEQLTSAAKDPQATLLAIEADPKSSEIMRLQATDAMGRLPDARTVARLKTLVSETSTHTTAPRQSHRAINALMQAQGAKAQPVILALLAHPDIQIRLTVAHAVVRFGDKAGKNSLRAHITHQEKDPMVHDEIAKLVAEIR